MRRAARVQVRRARLRIDRELTDGPLQEWADEIETVLLHAPLFAEIALFLEPNRTPLRPVSGGGYLAACNRRRLAQGAVVFESIRARSMGRERSVTFRTASSQVHLRQNGVRYPGQPRDSPVRGSEVRSLARNAACSF